MTSRECGYLANGKYVCKDKWIPMEVYINRDVIPLKEMTDDYTMPWSKMYDRKCTIMVGETCNPKQPNPCCKGSCEPVYDEITDTLVQMMYACTDSNMRSFKSEQRRFYACPIP